jgi:hypothetical protein
VDRAAEPGLASAARREPGHGGHVLAARRSVKPNYGSEGRGFESLRACASRQPEKAVLRSRIVCPAPAAHQSNGVAMVASPASEATIRPPSRCYGGGDPRRERSGPRTKDLTQRLTSGSGHGGSSGSFSCVRRMAVEGPRPHTLHEVVQVAVLHTRRGSDTARTHFVHSWSRSSRPSGSSRTRPPTVVTKSPTQRGFVFHSSSRHHPRRAFLGVEQR